jgi:uncharacterized SAM-binding protein YcdF (DUF218 family)
MPTRNGWLLLGLLYIAAMMLIARNVVPFLSPNAPLRSDALVIEGWVPDYVVEHALKEFKANHYSRLYVTGGPVEKGGLLLAYRTYAEVGAATLVRLGLDEKFVRAVPAPQVHKDRTYISAVALREWLRREEKLPAAFDLVSEGPHSRRSRLLFEKAFGHDARIGIISVQSQDYDPSRWWRYSAGVRNVVSELLAYCYAALFFNKA